jgi:hypothetical protein
LTNHFHSNGPAAYARAREFERRKGINAKYADALSKASWIQRLYLRFEMWCEFSYAKKENHMETHKPSPYTLW